MKAFRTPFALGHKIVLKSEGGGAISEGDKMTTTYEVSITFPLDNGELATVTVEFPADEFEAAIPEAREENNGQAR